MLIPIDDKVLSLRWLTWQTGRESENDMKGGTVQGRFVLRKKRRSGSHGFKCSLVIPRGPEILGRHMGLPKLLSEEKLGITSDFHLTHNLYVSFSLNQVRYQFFHVNRANVNEGKRLWRKKMDYERTCQRNIALRKHQILSYDFHLNIFCRPRLRYNELREAFTRTEVNPGVLGIPEYARSGMIYLFERLLVVNQSRLHRWWYIFWVTPPKHLRLGRLLEEELSRYYGVHKIRRGLLASISHLVRYLIHN